MEHRLRAALSSWLDPRNRLAHHHSIWTLHWCHQNCPCYNNHKSKAGYRIARHTWRTNTCHWKGERTDTTHCLYFGSRCHNPLLSAKKHRCMLCPEHNRRKRFRRIQMHFPLQFQFHPGKSNIHLAHRFHHHRSRKS